MNIRMYQGLLLGGLAALVAAAWWQGETSRRRPRGTRHERGTVIFKNTPQA